MELQSLRLELHSTKKHLQLQIQGLQLWYVPVLELIDDFITFRDIGQKLQDISLQGDMGMVRTVKPL